MIGTEVSSCASYAKVTVESADTIEFEKLVRVHGYGVVDARFELRENLIAERIQLGLVQDPCAVLRVVSRGQIVGLAHEF